MTEGSVLLVGLETADRDRLLAGVRGAQIGARVIEIAALQDAVHALANLDAQCVVVGAGAAVAGWEIAGSELRRVAPHAALIAVTAVASPGSVWDDVVRPHERDPALIARVVRSGFAIAAANGRLVRWAMRDPLTDLLNRRGLERVLAREASERERGHGPLAALLVDCDNFKAINDRFGLATGDDVLRRVADALTRSVRSRDTVARVGGDEFVVLLPHTRTWEAVEVAERIRQQVREIVRLPDETGLSVSIGVRRLGDRITSVRDVVEATQGGLQQSKVAGKDQVRVVDERGLSSAVVGQAQSKLDPELSFPPGTRMFAFTSTDVVDTDTGAVVARLLRPDMPAEAALVLSTHRASQSAWDLHWFSRALAQVQTWEVTVHARIFPATLLELPTDQVRAVVPKHAPMERIVLTIDDQFLSGDVSSLRLKIDPLRKHGASVCIDVTDLGRTSLESMILLRPERVKIDQALLRGITGSRIRSSGIGRFAKVCNALEIEPIAGGPVDDADRQALIDLGVRLHER